MKDAVLAARAGLLLIALALGACSATRTQQSAGEVVDDSVLTAKVKAALIEDPVAKAATSTSKATAASCNSAASSTAPSRSHAPARSLAA